jgi:ubiquinone biosynthesis protein
MPDLRFGAFTDEGPWAVDPAAMPWRADVDGRRDRAHARVPGLVRRRRLPPLRGLQAGARLAVTLAPWAARHRRDRGSTGSLTELSARIRPVFESLGPAYVKLGQLIASAEGLLPIELVEEFKRCRDRVPPEPFRRVRAVVEADLGQPLDAVFASFDREPLAAASIAQVHAARLLTGEDVVVKVQRPGIESVIAADLAALAWLAPRLERRTPTASLANLPAYVELFAETIVEELDFRLEAENLLDVARVLATVPDRPVVVPRPHPELVTRRVLVMQRMEGFTIDDGAGMAAAGVDPHPVFRALMVMLVEGALIHGVFHGDLHGGNLLVQPDGRACIFDLGITGRLTEPERHALVGFLLSMVAQDTMAQLAHFGAMGGLPPGADLDAIAADLDLERMTPAAQAEMTPEELAELMQESMQQLVAHGGRFPKPLFLYIKNNVYLNGAITALAPDIDVLAEIGAAFEHLATQHGEQVKAETGLDLTDAAFSADAVAEVMRAQLGQDAEGLTAHEVNEIQSQRLRDMHAARRR